VGINKSITVVKLGSQDNKKRKPEFTKKKQESGEGEKTARPASFPAVEDQRTTFDIGGCLLL
jgi:hypothetical protein